MTTSSTLETTSMDKDAKIPGKPILDVGLPRNKTAVDELPPPSTGRWTVRRKAAVVEAVLSGVISVEEVCRRYDLSVEEFLSWHNTMKMHGIRGLHTTMLQRYRHSRAKGIETALRAVTDAINEFGGSNESNCCRGRGVRCRRDAQFREQSPSNDPNRGPCRRSRDPRPFGT
jgi:transposase-like protein